MGITLDKITQDCNTLNANQFDHRRYQVVERDGIYKIACFDQDQHFIGYLDNDTMEVA